MASKSLEENTTVSFTLSAHAGTAEDPVPVYQSTVIRLTAGSSIALCYKGEKQTVSFSAKNVTATVNGTALEAVNDVYTVEMEHEAILLLTSTATENIDLALSIQPIA